MRPSAPLLPTPQQTIGPFFPRTLSSEGGNDPARVVPAAAPTARGEAVLLRGTVEREGGFPCPNTTIEAWRANAGGRFGHPLDPERHLAEPQLPRLEPRLDERGGPLRVPHSAPRLLPGGYADATGRRAPHDNLTAMGRG